MKRAFFKSIIFWSALFLFSCVVTQGSPDSETESGQKCFYDEAGFYRCGAACYGSECACRVSAMELCSFRNWEASCRACDNPRFYNDLQFSGEPFYGCSRYALCNLCEAGFSVCDYPRSEWRFEFRPGPPPPPRHPPRHRRGRPDDFPKR